MSTSRAEPAVPATGRATRGGGPRRRRRPACSLVAAATARAREGRLGAVQPPERAAPRAACPRAVEPGGPTTTRRTPGRPVAESSARPWHAAAGRAPRRTTRRRQAAGRGREDDPEPVGGRQPGRGRATSAAGSHLGARHLRGDGTSPAHSSPASPEPGDRGRAPEPEHGAGTPPRPHDAERPVHARSVPLAPAGQPPEPSSERRAGHAGSGPGPDASAGSGPGYRLRLGREGLRHGSGSKGWAMAAIGLCVVVLGVLVAGVVSRDDSGQSSNTAPARCPSGSPRRRRHGRGAAR